MGSACCDHSDGHAEKTAKDLVCGMTVDPNDAYEYNHQGKTYYFCSEGCQKDFSENPEEYLNPKPVSENDSARLAQVEHTCPMHPEIRQMGPGSCPICGMALEPVEMTLEEGPNHELIDMTRRFKWATALSLPVFLIAMSEMLPGSPVQHKLGMKFIVWSQLLLATPVVLWAGWPLFERGWQSVKNKNLNMFSLISLGTGAAYLYSLVAALFPQIFPETLKTHDGAVGVYFEAASVIVALVLLGQVMELKARSQTGGAIRALLGLAPKTASAF